MQIILQLINSVSKERSCVHVVFSSLGEGIFCAFGGVLHKSSIRSLKVASLGHSGPKLIVIGLCDKITRTAFEEEMLIVCMCSSQRGRGWGVGVNDFHVKALRDFFFTLTLPSPSAYENMKFPTTSLCTYFENCIGTSCAVRTITPFLSALAICFNSEFNIVRWCFVPGRTNQTHFWKRSTEDILLCMSIFFSVWTKKYEQL